MLNLETIKQNLRLQKATTPATGSGKRPAERGVAEGVKSKPAPNHNPRQSLALTSYSEWDMVRRFTYETPKVRCVDVCGRCHI
jgi:hypothetical protein